MQGDTIPRALAIACVGTLLLAACSDEATSPPPGAARPASAALAVSEPLPEGILEREALAPFFINQMPELMFRSNVELDFIIQRLVSEPTLGAWHTHSGPTFSMVKQGTVVITTYDKKNGCVSTTYHAGDTYVEPAGEVHKAMVPEPYGAVEYKARFYIPVGGPLSSPAAAPDCS